MHFCALGWRSASAAYLNDVSYFHFPFFNTLANSIRQKKKLRKDGLAIHGCQRVCTRASVGMPSLSVCLSLALQCSLSVVGCMWVAWRVAIRLSSASERPIKRMSRQTKISLFFSVSQYIYYERAPSSAACVTACPTSSTEWAPSFGAAWTFGAFQAGP